MATHQIAPALARRILAAPDLADLADPQALRGFRHLQGTQALRGLSGLPGLADGLFSFDGDPQGAGLGSIELQALGLAVQVITLLVRTDDEGMRPVRPGQGQARPPGIRGRVVAASTVISTETAPAGQGRSA